MFGFVKTFVGLLKSFRRFLFHHDAHEFRWHARIPFVLVRTVWMVVEDFWINRGTQKSAALAYTSILSLFPLMAIMSIFAAFFYEGGPDEAENLVVGLMQRYVLPTEPIEITDTSLDATAPTGAISPRVNTLEQTIRDNFRQFRSKAKTIAGVGGFGLFLAAMALFTAC